MQAIILAAGMGKRLKELTNDNTKCMVKVNEVTLIERMLHQIDKYSLSKIVIVVGYKGQKLIDYINTLDVKTPITYVDNPIFDKTNNIYSLALAKDYLLEEDTLLFESDLIFEDSVLDELINDSRKTLCLVDKYELWMDGTCVVLDENDSIAAFVPGKSFKFSEKENYYKTVNIYKFSVDFSEKYYVPFLDAYQKALGENEYYEQVLRVITMLDEPEIKAKRLNGQLWYEIDDIQDLDIASSMFNPDEDKKLEMISGRYGGYWRYPQLLDFCYLVNPYYPPEKMLDEIKASFDLLITQYPSGMSVNSLLAGRNFGVKKENIVVGNGAAELIKCLMAGMEGNVGIIRPTFEEYGHRYDDNKLIVFIPQKEDFSYSVDDIIDFYKDKEISNLILINPDNPTGNYIPKNELLHLVEWTKENNIVFVVDESFVDFSDEQDPTLIKQNILDDNSKLYVMKSISKSFGVPGLRLGIMASGDVNKINELKKDVSIWNINSFAELYMQIFEKYKKEYFNALDKFRKERIRFINRISEIEGLGVFPSQANYIMVELLNGFSAKELTKAMLIKHNIYIKDLTSKIDRNGRQFVRIAVRKSEENDTLIDSLKKILEGK